MTLVVQAWILISALLCGAGWILSALHELNPAGYLTVLALVVAGLIWQWPKIKPRSPIRFARVWPWFPERQRPVAPMDENGCDAGFSPMRTRSMKPNEPCYGLSPLCCRASIKRKTL